MLSSLHIENIALIKSLSLELDGGFCVFTGETGAGKSILIDAVNMLCGARSDRSLIRTGEKYALVEGAFGGFSKIELDALSELEVEPDEDGLVFLSRRLSADGKASSKINGRPVPVSRLRKVAEKLIRIHGQQDTRQLSDVSSFVGFLDRFAGDEEALENYRNAYHKLLDLENELAELETDEGEKRRRADYLEYAISEIKAANLKVGEEEKLEAYKLRLLNTERIIAGCSAAYDALYGAESGTANQLVDAACRELNALAKIMPEAGALAERLESVIPELEDIAETIAGYIDEDTGDLGARLDKIEERLNVLQEIKRKYGGSIEAALELCESMEDELSRIENSDEYIKKLTDKIDKARKLMHSCANELTQKRKIASEKLALQMREELEFLDMGKLNFVVEVTEAKPSASGMDAVRFLVSTNTGEPPKPIEKIASGGELSRIMLALMSVLSRSDGAGTLIFDEIDTGISGKTSRKIGLKLKKLTKSDNSMQVICVTHSAQIASLADLHLKITKEERDRRTFTFVEQLDRSGRIDELARIIGGTEVTEPIYAAAKELLEQEV